MSRTTSIPPQNRMPTDFTVPRLLEREAELATLDALVDALVGGEAAVGLIEGAAGIGKSRLLNEARRRATDAGGYMTLEDGTVLVFGLYASGSSFPVLYDGLVEVGEDLAQVAASFQQALSES